MYSYIYMYEGIISDVHCCILISQEVFKSPGFNEMSEDALSFILKSDKLTMDEGDILEKAKEWAHVNSVRIHRNLIFIYILCILPPFLKVVTGSTLSDVAKMVIQHVRLPLLEPEALSEIELQNAKDQFIPVRPK